MTLSETASSMHARSVALQRLFRTTATRRPSRSQWKARVSPRFHPNSPPPPHSMRKQPEMRGGDSNAVEEVSSDESEAAPSLSTGSEAGDYRRRRFLSSGVAAVRNEAATRSPTHRQQALQVDLHHRRVRRRRCGRYQPPYLSGVDRHVEERTPGPLLR